MTISDELVQFVADYEAFKAMPYRGVDSQNQTIGFGHVITAKDGTKYDNGITREEAWDLLLSDLQEAVDAVNKLSIDLGIQFTQSQFDALVSFTFNSGPFWINPRNDSILRYYLATGNFERAMERLLYNYFVGSDPVLGLYRRRVDEMKMFTEGIYERTYPNWPDGGPPSWD